MRLNCDNCGNSRGTPRIKICYLDSHILLDSSNDFCEDWKECEEIYERGADNVK